MDTLLEAIGIVLEIQKNLLLETALGTSVR